MAANVDAIEQVQSIGEQYKYGFVTDIDVDLAPKGLNEDIVRLISEKKGSLSGCSNGGSRPIAIG